jgi:hypothetical protein
VVVKQAKQEDSGSSPVGRGGAGTYIEGELGAFYLLQMLANSEARGLPDARIEWVQFQGVDEGYALDDLIIHGTSDKGTSILEIQSKRTVTFSAKDSIFQSVCDQIVRSAPASKPNDRHLLAVATQRTSFAISGPYQDVLEWARTAQTGEQFFKRLALKGVASDAMRSFAQTFRANLIARGVADDDEMIWSIIRRFLILEFDFESGAPQARAHALTIASQVLAPADAARAKALWSNLIEFVINTGKTGSSITRYELAAMLVARGFRLAGDRNYALARARLAEMSRFSLMDIGTTVGGINLPRLRALARWRQRATSIALSRSQGIRASANPVCSVISPSVRAAKRRSSSSIRLERPTEAGRCSHSASMFQGRPRISSTTLQPAAAASCSSTGLRCLFLRSGVALSMTYYERSLG